MFVGFLFVLSPFAHAENCEHHLIDVSVVNSFVQVHSLVIEPRLSKAGHSAETLVLVHGLDSAWQSFLPVIERLSERYRLILIDQPGHGRSGNIPTSFTLEDFARALHAVLRHLGVESAHFLGHSYGARSLLKLYEIDPALFTSLVVEDIDFLADDIGEYEPFQIEAERLREFQLVYGSKEELVTAIQNVFGPRAPDMIERKTAIEADGSFRLLFRPYVSHIYGYAAGTADLSEPLKAFDKPILLLAAPWEATAIRPEGYLHMRRLQPRLTYQLIRNSRHNIHGSKPEEFVDAVYRFLPRNP